MKNTTSIFNKDLQITEEQYAVSYAKRSYESLKPGDNFGLAEHAFIIIQTTNMFYRAEVKSREIAPKQYDYIIDDHVIAFVDERTFKEASIGILHKTQLKDVIHHTWLIDKSKVFDLKEDIFNDMGSIEIEEKKSIPYFDSGNKSLQYPGKTTDFFVENLRLLTFLGCFSAGIYKAKKILTNPGEHTKELASVAHNCEYACNVELFKEIISTLTVACSPLWTNAIINETTPPKQEFPKVHSCATWAAEKLHNLHIEQIDRDLNPSILLSIIDKIGYLTTLHMGNAEEIRNAAVHNCPQKRAEINKGAACLQEVRQDVDDLINADEHKFDRCIITGAVAVAGVVATDMTRQKVVQTCFDR